MSKLKYSILAFIIVAVFYTGFFPFFPNLHSANELSRLYLSWAIVYDHSFQIDNQLHTFGNIADRAVKEHKYFSDKPPGTSFIGAVPLFIKKLFRGQQNLFVDLRISRTVNCLIPALILLILLIVYMRESQISDEVIAFTIFSFGFGSLLFSYSLLLYEHTLIASLVFSVFFIATRKNYNPIIITLAGFLSALSISSEYQSVLYISLITLFIFYSILRQKKYFNYLFYIIGFAVPVSLLLYYNYSCFGSLFEIGYDNLAGRFFRQAHSQGIVGVTYPRLEPFMGSFLSLSKGILFFSPITVFGLLSVIFYRKNPGESIFLFVIKIVFPVVCAIFVSSMVFWESGWTVSQRHFTTVIPFVMLFFAFIVNKYEFAKVIAPTLSVCSILVTGFSTLTFPHLPESFKNPFHQIVIPLIQKDYYIQFFRLSYKTSLIISVVGFLFIILFSYLILRNLKIWKIVLSVVFIIIFPLMLYFFTKNQFPLTEQDFQRRFNYFERQYNAIEPYFNRDINQTR